MEEEHAIRRELPLLLTASETTITSSVHSRRNSNRSARMRETSNKSLTRRSSCTTWRLARNEVFQKRGYLVCHLPAALHLLLAAPYPQL